MVPVPECVSEDSQDCINGNRSHKTVYRLKRLCSLPPCHPSTAPKAWTIAASAVFQAARSGELIWETSLPDKMRLTSRCLHLEWYIAVWSRVYCSEVFIQEISGDFRPGQR